MVEPTTKKVSHPAVVLWVRSAGSVVIKLLKEWKWTKENNKCSITCYLKAKEEIRRGYRSILKTKRFSEIETEALRWRITTPQEPVEALIENDPVHGSD